MFRASVPLEQLILRITQERGSFSNLLEESLLDEIQLDKQNNLEQHNSDIFLAENLSLDDDSNSQDENNTDSQVIMDEERFDEALQKLKTFVEVAQGSPVFLKTLCRC